jgi:hypothetical protein
MIMCDNFNVETYEKWMPVLGYEDLYEVSSFGRVKSCEKEVWNPRGWYNKYPERILKTRVTKTGYVQVHICSDGVGVTTSVHRLVAFAFFGEPPGNKYQVNHKNGIKTDNRPENLEWVTAKENIQHAHKVLKITPSRTGCFGRDNKTSKKVFQIRNGEIIGVFYGTRDAERKTGVASPCICAAISGRQKTAGGYVWANTHSIGIKAIRHSRIENRKETK